jgi:uncharacterized phage protein (TIGR02216 family)
MRIGLGVLRLSPKNFWAMTPREFAAATGVFGQRGAPPGRGELNRMMGQFPDRTAHG